MNYALSVADLLTKPTSDSPAITLGFYGPGSGGATFVWDAGLPKSKHDGGLVIDPSVSAAPGADDWYVSPNVGYGCWRGLEEEHVSIMQYGARSLFNSTRAIQYAMYRCMGYNAGYTLTAPPGVFGVSELVPGYGLYINEPLKFHGSGMQKTTLKNLSPTGRVLYGACGFTDIAGFTIDNNGGSGVPFRQGGQYSTSKNIELKNMVGSNYALEIDGSTLATLENFLIHEVDNGVDIGATTPTNYVRLEQFTIGQKSGKGLRINRGSDIRVNGATFEPNFESSANHDHFIFIANSSRVNIDNFTCEDSTLSQNISPEYIKIQDSKSVAFKGRVSHRGSSGKAIIGLYGTETHGVDVGNVLWIEESPGMALVKNNTGGVSGVHVSEITTQNSTEAKVIDCVSQVGGLSVENITDSMAGSTLYLSGERVDVKNVPGSITVAVGCVPFFVNCPGAPIGQGGGSWNSTVSGPIDSVATVVFEKYGNIVTLYVPTTVAAGNNTSGAIYLSGLPVELRPAKGNIFPLGLVSNAGNVISGGSVEIDTVGNIVVSQDNGQQFQQTTSQVGFYRFTVTYISAV